MTITEFLLQPDIAYLLLVSGFLLLLMALLTPGTGFFELGALFVLFLAGWEVYNLPINAWALIVLILGVIPFWLAVRRSGNLWFLALSILTMIIGSAFLFQGESWRPAVHPLTAIVVSTLTAGFMWLITVKTLEAQQKTPTHDLSGLIGQHGITRTDVHHEGTVYVHQEDWSAWSQAPIPAGEEIRVTGREGFVLQVERIEQLEAE